MAQDDFFLMCKVIFAQVTGKELWISVCKVGLLAEFKMGSVRLVCSLFHTNALEEKGIDFLFFPKQLWVK